METLFPRRKKEKEAQKSCQKIGKRKQRISWKIHYFSDNFRKVNKSQEACAIQH